jgi:threonine/homoserine/homoserine lactone efflux protein
MDLPNLARGFILGLSIAAVVGPIALLCLRRSLTAGFAIGFASGLGAATADATYAAIASFGVSAVASLLVEQRLWLRLAGGGALLLLGCRALRAKTPTATVVAPFSSLQIAGAYSSTLGLTLTNPMTVLSFAAVFAGIGRGSLDLVGGVFVGSGVWWLMLAAAASRLRTSFTPPRVRLVNLASGTLICGFGLQTLISAVLET